jgi:uncharacterized protein (DUF1800 family)
MTARIWPTAEQAIKHARRIAAIPLAWDPAALGQSRFGFGWTPASHLAFNAHGPTYWWNSQVAFAQQHPIYAAHPQIAAQGPLLRSSPAQVRAWLKARGNEYGWDTMDQLTRVTLGLQTYSRAQLYESAVDFFSNHLNVSNHNGDVWNTRHTHDRDVVRRHAFGSFSDMLVASSKNPAMLLFLNLAQSNKTAVNENYGRELLELHTVGVGAGYGETGVKSSARVLTGRTLDATMNYRYDPSLHWTGRVTILGFTHANTSAAGGEAVGDAYLRYLAAHPKTAQHLALKLCTHYVSDRPSAALVAAVAAEYLKHKTQILPTISAIFRSDEFWSSRGLKVRRPAENLIATVRVLGNQVSDYPKALETLHWMTASLGQVPLDWSAPNGYPDVAAAWRSSSSLLNNWEQQIGFAQGWWDGYAKLKPEVYYGRNKPKTSGAAIDVLTLRLTGQKFNATHKAALQKFLGEPASTPIEKSALRWTLSSLLPLILHGPHHALN